MHGRPYEYGTPSYKRQRSDSEYSYNTGQFGTNTASAYATHLQSPSHAWQAQSDNAALYHQMMNQAQPQAINVPRWQRPAMQGPYSAPPGGPGTNLFYNTGHATSTPTRRYANDGYPHQQSQRFDSGVTGDEHPSLSGIQPPPSLPEPADTSRQHPGLLSTPDAVSGDFQQRHGLQTSHGQYDFGASAMNRPMQNYQPMLQSTSGNQIYGQHPQPMAAGQYTHGQLGFDQNIFQEPGRDTYAPSASAMPEASAPLESGVLNTRFAPPSLRNQALHGEATGDNLT